jgi:hypothetical protein
MLSPPLILKRASANRPSGQWNDDGYDVFADGVVVGRSFNLSFTMRSGTTRATARTLAESFRLGLALTHSLCSS